MKQKGVEKETWLELNDAAQYLGVHFTTLRRWADAGEIAFLRTPGGRRRFSMTELQNFLRQRMQNVVSSLAKMQPLEDLAIDHARQNAQFLYTARGEWMGRLNSDQRAWLKGTGHRLMGLLLQYAIRSEGDEAFLDEGRRIAREYGQVCFGVGLPLPDTVRVFLFFRRSILEAVYETGSLGGSEDMDGRRLYQRTTDFFDDLLLALIESYPDRSSVFIEENMS